MDTQTLSLEWKLNEIAETKRSLTVGKATKSPQMFEDSKATLERLRAYEDKLLLS